MDKVTKVKSFLNRFSSGVPGLLIDIVDYGDHIGLRLYRENFENFSESDRHKITEWIGIVIMSLGENGIPSVVEVSDYVPNFGDIK